MRGSTGWPDRGPGPILASMFRRKAAPPRLPHPDPRVEAELQRIISLRRALDRREAQLDADTDSVRILRRRLRRDADAGEVPQWQQQIADLREEIERLEAEVAGLHDQVEKRIGTLDDTDLTYL
jgi:chromosome segregation ATPase